MVGAEGEAPRQPQITRVKNRANPSASRLMAAPDTTWSARRYTLQTACSAPRKAPTPMAAIRAKVGLPVE